MKRVKIDFNRKESEAFYFKSSLARKIYQYYHNQIHKLISYNLNNFSQSLLVDIHGFEKVTEGVAQKSVEEFLDEQLSA